METDVPAGTRTLKVEECRGQVGPRVSQESVERGVNKKNEGKRSMRAAYTCAPLSESSSPLLRLNTAVRRGRFLDRNSSIWTSATTLMPSSVAPGAVETESKWAEKSTASSVVFVEFN
jgi:hypothetical protein